MDVSVERRSSFEGIEQDWNFLKNKISKGFYDPSLDLDVLKSVFEIIKDSVYVLTILIVRINDEPIAILPFYVLNNPCLTTYGNHISEFDHLLLGEGIPLHFHPMINLDYLDLVEPYFISYISYEWSFDIEHPKIKHYKEYDGIVLAPFEDYLKSLKDSKDRKEFARLLRKNSDVQTIVSDKTLEHPLFKSLLDEYISYRDHREVEDQAIFPEWMKKFTSSEVYLSETFIILEHAARHGRLHTLEFYLDGRLIAVNFAVKIGSTMVDYMSLRDMSGSFKNRSLGLFAILKNIEHAWQTGCIHYDLGTPTFTKNFDYKQKFYNKKFKVPFVSNLSDLVLYNYIKNNYDDYPVFHENSFIQDKNEILLKLNTFGRKRLKFLKNVSERCGLNSDILISEI